MPWVFVSAPRLFSSCREWRLPFILLRGLLTAVASLIVDWAQIQARSLQQLPLADLVALLHVGSQFTNRNQTHVPCIGRCILNHSTAREVPGAYLFGNIQPATHWCVCARLLQLCLTLCDPVTVAHQTPLSKGFFRQEYWSGMPCLSPGYLLNPGIEPASPAPPALQADSLPLSHCGSPRYTLVQFSSVRSLSRVQLFAITWTAARQASLSITNSRSLLKLFSIESVMPSNHLIICRPLLPPSIFSSIRVFSNESVLRIRWPKC